jgi:hypothetical protein
MTNAQLINIFFSPFIQGTRQRTWKIFLSYFLFYYWNCIDLVTFNLFKLHIFRSLMHLSQKAATSDCLYWVNSFSKFHQFSMRKGCNIKILKKKEEKRNVNVNSIKNHPYTTVIPFLFTNICFFIHPRLGSRG